MAALIRISPLRRIAGTLLIALWWMLLGPGCRETSAPDSREAVTIDGEVFRLEVAADEVTRTNGLMHRTGLSPDGGMLFIFLETEVRSFWMANCLINIDVIFLDGRGRITALHRMKAIPPRGDDETEEQYERRCHLTGSYGSVYPAQFAIELPSNSLDRLDVGVDDRIDLDLTRLKALAR